MHYHGLNHLSSMFSYLAKTSNPIQNTQFRSTIWKEAVYIELYLEQSYQQMNCCMCWVWDFYGCYLIRWVLEGTCYNSASFFYLLKTGTKLYFALRWTQEWELVFSGKHFIIFDKFTFFVLWMSISR